MTPAQAPGSTPTASDRIAMARNNGCDDPAKFVQSNPLRELICDLADIEHNGRFDGKPDRTGLTLPQLREIAARLSDPAAGDKSRDEIDALSRKQLLLYVCERAGSEYSPTAGIQWALTKDNLKAIYYALEGDRGTKTEAKQ